jgi:uncharacterized RDD family membrane protein YckC
MSDRTPYPPPPEGNGPPPTAEQPTAPPPPGPPGGADPYATQPGYGYGAPPPPPAGGYTPYPIGDSGPVSHAGQPPELFMRFLARAIDNILIGIVSAVIGGIIAAIFDLGSMSYGYSVGASYAASAVSGVLGAALTLAYFALLESRSGQTVGKMALRMRTLGPDGNPPTLEEAVRRNFWVALGALAIIPFIGPLIGALAELAIVIVIAVTIGRSPIGQGWHDRFAGGTRVVRTR